MTLTQKFHLTSSESDKLLNILKNTDESLYFIIGTQIQLEKEQKSLEKEFVEISEKLYSGNLSRLLQDNIKNTHNKILNSIVSNLQQQLKFRERTND